MMMMTENAATTDDEDAELATADRGNELADGAHGKSVSEKTADDKTVDDKNDARQRDAKGRFQPLGAVKDQDDEAEESDDDEDHENEDDEGEDVAAAAGLDATHKAVPYSRFKQVVDKANRLATENTQLKTSLPRDATPKQQDPIEAISTQLEALYVKVEEARADGDTKTAAQLQQQIDGKNRELVRLDSTSISTRAAYAAQQNARYDAMLDVLEQAIDKINPASDDFDEAATKELEFQVAAHEKMGMSAPQALQRAAKLLFQVDPFSRSAVKEATKAQEKAAPEKKVDVKKALDTQNKQPPDAADRGVNNDSTKINVMALSDEDFERLPESKKKELRGDFA